MRTKKNVYKVKVVISQIDGAFSKYNDIEFDGNVLANNEISAYNKVECHLRNEYPILDGKSFAITKQCELICSDVM